MTQVQLSPLKCLLLFVLIADSTSLARSSRFNVRAFGAKGNGVADDTPAIQRAEVAAEEAGGGAIYIPAGRYRMNGTVFLGSNIEIYGDGDSTVLLRTNTVSQVPEYGPDCATPTPPQMAMRFVFSNRHYNCQDKDVHLHDLQIDDSGVTQVPNSVVLAFSGLVDSIVDHITIKDAPQDAMFFRNGGRHLLVDDNKILSHDRSWGNGGGINVEMHRNGQIWGEVTITNNFIVTVGPRFCSAALGQVCTGDSDCLGHFPPTCGRGTANAAAILIDWVDGTHPPIVKIAKNRIWVGNNHFGIICNGCDDSTISGNVIQSASIKGISTSGTFTGISSNITPAGEVHRITIENNTIEGTGEADDGSAIYLNGRAGRDYGLLIRSNIVRHKMPSITRAVVEVHGWKDVDLSGNHLCFVPDNDIRIGGLGDRAVKNGKQRDNEIVHVGKSSGSLSVECETQQQ